MKKYYVTKDDKQLMLAHESLHKLGVLVPCGVSMTTFFEGSHGLGKRKAGYAIKRTKRVADKLRKSVVSEWDKIADLVAPGEYVIKEMP